MLEKKLYPSSIGLSVPAEYSTPGVAASFGDPLPEPNFPPYNPGEFPVPGTPVPLPQYPPFDLTVV